MVIKRQMNAMPENLRTEVASLKVQFVGLSEQVKAGNQSTNDGFANVNNQFANVGAQIKDLSDRISTPRHIPWTPIFGTLAILVTIGIAMIGFGFNSIQSGMSDIKVALAASIEKNDARFTVVMRDMNTELAKKVSKDDLKSDIDVRDARSLEVRTRLEAEILALHAEMVPKAAYDEYRAADTRAGLELQRQIDHLTVLVEALHHP